MPDLALQVLLLLFLAAMLAGFIDAIAGGGGMITIPAMLLASIPPLQVLGTNKLQSLFGSGSARWAYARHGHVDLKGQLPMVLTAALGAIGGALLATVIPVDWLKWALPFLLVGIAVYFGLKPDIGHVDRHQRMRPQVFALTFVPQYMLGAEGMPRRIVDYPALWAYTRRLYAHPAVAPTVDMDHIKRHYYQSHRHINPTGIVPEGPALDFSLDDGAPKKAR